MPAVDALVGEGLNPSPYKEALERIAELDRRWRGRLERAEAELAEWRDGDRQHPLTVHGYKIMVRHLTDERRKAEAERDRYHDALIARHGGEPIALLSELDEARAERDALRKDAERYRWLRERLSHQRCGPHVGWGTDTLLPGDDPDAAIDAARKEGEG